MAAPHRAAPQQAMRRGYASPTGVLPRAVRIQPYVSGRSGAVGQRMSSALRAPLSVPQSVLLPMAPHRTCPYPLAVTNDSTRERAAEAIAHPADPALADAEAVLDR